jgi:hypothetical protein
MSFDLNDDVNLSLDKSDGSGESEVLLPNSFKSIIVLFILFFFVVSDIFNTYVLSNFKGATDGRNATAFGMLLQGTVLVIMYMCINYFINKGFM